MLFAVEFLINIALLVPIALVFWLAVETYKSISAEH